MRPLLQFSILGWISLVLSSEYSKLDPLHDDDFEQWEEFAARKVHHGEDYKSHLTEAVAEGDLDRVKKLISPSAIQSSGGHALFTAVQLNHTDIAKLLIANDANLEYRELHAVRNTAWTPLIVAAETGNTEMIKLLIKSGALVSEKNLSTSALTEACCLGHLRATKILLAAGGNPNFISKYWSSPLICTARRGDLAMARFLIAAGADPSFFTSHRNSAITEAASKGHLGIVRLLLTKKKKNLEVVSVYNGTPLVAAARNGHLEVVRLLIKAGANVNTFCHPGGTALDVARDNKHYDVVRALKAGKSMSESIIKKKNKQKKRNIR